jgi:hypothetical protein
MRDKFVGFLEASCALITQLLSDVICPSTPSVALESFIATEILAKADDHSCSCGKKFSMAFGTDTAVVVRQPKALHRRKQIRLGDAGGNSLPSFRHFTGSFSRPVAMIAQNEVTEIFGENL